VATQINIQESPSVLVTVDESVTNVTTGSSAVNVSIDQSSTTSVLVSADQGPQGVKGNTGDTGAASTVAGPTGNGISNITRTSGNGAAGTTDTFTITYTNGSTTTFQVYNGTNGTNGRGITSIARSSGNGTAGTTDTYTINYTDSTTSTFNVVNGANGTNGQGVPVGGTTGQALVKIDGTDYNTQWSTPAATGVTSVTAGTGLTTGGSPITSTGTIAIDSTVATLTGSQILTNKTLTSPVISTITNTGTLTLPTTTGTIALTSGDITGNAATATTAGNLSGTQTQKYVYAAPNATNGTASFRALVASDLPSASTAAAGIVQLEDSTSSTSTTKAATPNSVNSAYNLAAGALPTSGGTMSGTLDLNYNALTGLTTLDINYVGSLSKKAYLRNDSNSNATVYFPTNSGQLIASNDSQTVSTSMLADNSVTTAKIGNSQITSAKIVDGTIVNDDISSTADIASSKISGTAKTVTVPSATQLAQEFMPGAGYLDIQPRFITSSSRSMGSNSFYSSYFMATKNITVTSITVYVSTAASPIGANNKVQVGIFQPSDSTGAYSASTPTHNKCLAIATKTGTSGSGMGGFGTAGLETFTLAASVTLTAGQIYGVGAVAWSTGGFTTPASLLAYPTGGTAAGLAPYTSGTITQSISSTVSIAVNDVFSVTTGASVTQWARLIA